MSAKRIVIKNGIVSGFADEVSFKGLDVIDYEKKRVSHIVPVPIAKRIAFNVIRAVFPEQSNIAEWTRHWACSWLVIIDRKYYGPFDDRQEAIRFEKQKIYEQGLQRFM